MAKNINHLQHVKSNVVENGLPKLPQPSVIVEGEIAVNYAKDYETLSIKNSSGEVVTFSSDNYYSEKKLGSWFIGENSGKTVTDVIRDDERIIAAALNDLKELKLDVSAYTQPDLSAYATEEWVEDRLGSGFTGENSGITVTKALEDDERAIAAALTDLDERKLDASAYTESVGNFYTKDEIDDVLGSGFTASSVTSSITDAFKENELIIASALNDLDDRKLDASAYTPTDLSNYYDKDEINGFLDDVDNALNSKVSAITINSSTKNPSNGNVNLGTVVSSMTVNGSAVTITNGAAALTGLATASELLKYADSAEYNTNDKKIYFKNGNTTLTSMTIDATAFIKDGMVNDVDVSGVTSGGSVVDCLVITFNTDAGKENINIPLSEMFDSSLFYTKTEIDNALGSGFTVSSITSSVTDVIKENEEVVAEALADLDSRISGNTTYITQVNAKADTIARSLSGYTPSGYSYSKGEVDVKLADKLDASAYTPTDLSDYYTKQEIDEDKLGSGFTGDNSGTTVTDAINLVERVASAALNDLNTRKLDASAYTPTDLSGYYNKTIIDSKLGEWFSGDTPETSVTEVIRENELAISSALNDLEERKLDASAYTQPDLSAYATKQWVEDDVLGSGFTGDNSGRTITEVIEDNELITSAALNDLNERLVDVEENQLTPSSFKTINNESIIGSGNIEIQGGGGSDANALSGVSVNGTAASVSNKVANITSVPADIVASSSTRTFVTTTEKSTWNTVTAKTDTTAFTQHTGDTTAHVTSAEKSTWNGKQDALSCGELKGTMNRSDVSGSGSISIKNTSGEFPTVVTAGTYKVVTYMSSTTQSYGLNVTFGGNAYSLTTSNGVIEDEREITITSNKTWSASVSGTVAANTVLIVKLYLISSNVSVLGLVAVSNDYDDLYNKPTIPTSLSDINSAHTHSEYALNTAFTAHTASTTVHVTTTEKSTWNGKQNHLINEDVLSGISSTDVTNWNNAISGVSFNGTDATVTNGKAAISAETGTEIVYLRLEYDNSAGTYKYDGTDTVLTADQIISLLEDKTKEVVLVYTISIWAENVHFYLRNKEVNVDDNYVSYKFSNVIQWTQETTHYQTFYQLRGINILHPTNTTPTTIYTSLDNFNLTPNTSFTAHTADTTAHVTSAEKSTWNGKQDALSNANVLSGISSTNVTNWNNAATSAHNHSNKSVLDNLTQAVITNSHTHSNKSVLDGISATNLLPAVTASDNGKILMVVNGAWALVNPTTIYTGSGTPQSGTGNDGDIYLQTS